MERNPDFAGIFNDFFKNTQNMRSTLKGVLLYSLVDIHHYEERDLIDTEWISLKDNDIMIKLDFLAIRMARYYWEIIDLEIQDADSRQTAPELDIKLKKIIKEYSSPKKIPSLRDLASDNMNDLRKKIIQYGVKPEALKKLKTKEHEWYEIVKDEMVIDKPIIDYFNEHHIEIKNRIKEKIKNHLKNYNDTCPDIESDLQYDSPFYDYLVRKNVSLFIISVEDTMMDNFDKTMFNKINLSDYQLPDEKVSSIWGVKQTTGNRKIWKNIQKDDIILFSRHNVCFLICRATKILEQPGISLWGDELGYDRNLLIMIDRLDSFALNLEHPNSLIDPRMPDAFNFSIIQISNEKTSRLAEAYGNIYAALNLINEHPTVQQSIKHTINSSSIQFVEGTTKFRRGQEKFRRMVLENYGNRCAVCKISEIKLLEASHILPVRNQDTSGSMDNGICFCSLHHKMFDSGYLFFDDDYMARLSEEVRNSKPLQNSLDLDVHIQTPHTMPNKTYLKSHRIRFGVEGDQTD